MQCGNGMKQSKYIALRSISACVILSVVVGVSGPASRCMAVIPPIVSEGWIDGRLAFGNGQVFGTFVSQGHNLIGDGTGSTGFTDGVNGDQVGTSTSPIDPNIGALKNNGGKTKTHALKAGSRAIDRGDNAGVPPTDQRGLPRVKDGNGDGIARVDVGAFER